ncbi:MAG: hypothetical protein P4N60_08905 [Verrucomicrobiae bacterium]|nr:hypothetical protein [Verrucomicrobiae bacterium]
MKADLRISIKDYSRSKNSEIHLGKHLEIKRWQKMTGGSQAADDSGRTPLFLGRIITGFFPLRRNREPVNP